VGRTVKNSVWNEVFAIILLGVGTLLFLALVSYNPKDLPSWVWFSKVLWPKQARPDFAEHNCLARIRTA
jgi:hypothetical protein